MSKGRAGRSRGEPEFVFLPLGGAGEIGMNTYLYGFGPANDRVWIMVDLGVKFSEDHEPGIDVVLPDLSFATSLGDRLLAIVLTHAHEDHFGAVGYLWPSLRVPVYATPFTASLLSVRLHERGLIEEVNLEVVPVDGRFSIGPFDLELVTVNHSIPEPQALVIRTPAGMAVHSGDWKIDNAPVFGPRIDEIRFRELGDEGCDAFICDSTNVLREGISPTEQEVADSLNRIIRSARGRVAVTTFASHVGRIETVAKAAEAVGRQVVVVGRAMHATIAAARNAGYLKDLPPIVDDEAFGYLPPDKVVCLCTGSQGEPRAALARIAEDTHPTISLEDGDLVIFSSKTIPGNEKAVIAIENNLAARGVQVITNDEHLVHVTGHPRRGELSQMYAWLRPKLLIPMHGEKRHLLEHKLFALERGVPRAEVVCNGEIMRLAPGEPAMVGEAPVGRVYLDGQIMVPADVGLVRARRKLSFVGAVMVSLVVDRDGRLVGQPQIALDGVPYFDGNGSEMPEIVRTAVEDVLDGVPSVRRRESRNDALEQMISQNVRRAVNMAWGKKPVCKVLLHRV
ncbi:ribonuclease J [Rhodoligotrophos defluvii]|uniref:ribonuclease J n=1 Tax=Rhodoligotrophos defluvii TaxID=2561934 RepID=UPI0010C97C8A|nr:ribonuclease J [Rhodoligotrophos defluvii]